MAGIAQNINRIKQQLPHGVELVAVSKFHPVERLREAYEAGQRIFGENRAQELAAKAPLMPQDVRWHFIGHLQKNKVRMIMPWVTTIQSIDSLQLLQLVDKEAARIDRHVEVMLQLHVAQETTKSGFTVDELLSVATGEEIKALSHVTIVASLTDDASQIGNEFETVKHTFDTLRHNSFAGNSDFKHLSMGMSDDWQVAVKCGSTLVRIGTSIFGPRRY